MRFCLIAFLLVCGGMLLFAFAQPADAQDDRICYMVLPNGREIGLEQLCGTNVGNTSRPAIAQPTAEELANRYPYVNPDTRLGLWYMQQGRNAEAQAEFSRSSRSCSNRMWVC